MKRVSYKRYCSVRSGQYHQSGAMKTKCYSGFGPLGIALLLFTADAQEVLRLSHVVATVSQEPNNVYLYRFELFNDSPGGQRPGLDSAEVWPAIIGYEIPLDSPSVVWDITYPDTWYYRFLSAEEYLEQYGTVNPFNSRYVLQWYDVRLPAFKMIVPEGYNERFQADEYEPSVDDFGFRSHLSPVDGPYAALWLDMFRFIGDPPLPGGQVSGGALPYQAIPEAEGQTLIAFLCLGMGLVIASRRAFVSRR
ncbi:MAG: hypothetical protein N3G20_06950 [Verrucomicrobiae bacterium]|nr:hypothetical protein [Verrucomicrobiae bacterium]